uniref:EBNA-3A-like protein n=1 Tax=Cercopithecine herpesvirus 12 TaxID=106332 RepID=Q99D36_CHV12|nr:EBNA-3A-like protein [Papiine gammaherpesvirus 1]
MEEDRPAAPAPDDSMEDEEAPSTSGVQEQAPGGDETIVVAEESDSGSEESSMSLSSPQQKGVKRKLGNDDEGAIVQPTPLPEGMPLLELVVQGSGGQATPLTLRAILQALGASSLHPPTRALDRFFGSQLPSTHQFVSLAMAIRQAVRDRRRTQAGIRGQVAWKLASPNVAWRMGYLTYRSWMYSYSDDRPNRILISLQVTLACESGARCHVAFSAGTFRPWVHNRADFMWMSSQVRVGEIVQSCDRFYRVFFDYLAIFKSPAFIWENVLAPEQRLAFMEFLGYLQGTDDQLVMRFVDDALRTTKIETPWLSANPGLALLHGWTAAMLRGRVLGRDALGVSSEEPGEDTPGETQTESEDSDSDADEEIPHIVSRDEEKSTRPPLFLRRMHRLMLWRTTESRKAQAEAHQMDGATPTDSAPRPTEGIRETGLPKGRRKALRPEPAPSRGETLELANMIRQQHSGARQTRDAVAPAISDVTQEPTVRPSTSTLGAGSYSQRADEVPGGANDQTPGGPGPFVRPWEIPTPQVPSPAPVLVRPRPIAVRTRLASRLAAPSSSAPVQGMSVASTPIRPATPRATLPGMSFGELGGPTHMPRPQYASPVGYLPARPSIHRAPGVPPPPTMAPILHGPVPRQEAMPRIGRPPLRPRVLRLPQAFPYFSPTGVPVRTYLALMRSRELGRPHPGVSMEPWSEHNISQVQVSTPRAPAPDHPRFPRADFRHSVGPGPLSGVPPLVPRQVPEPIRQWTPGANIGPRQQMIVIEPIRPQNQMFPQARPGQGVDMSQIPAAEPQVPPYVEIPVSEPSGSGHPLVSAVTQCNVSQYDLGEDSEVSESIEELETSEIGEALDLSIHNRPVIKTPEIIVVEHGGNQSDIYTGARVKVSAMVHSGQGADLPDLEDPQDEE